jgi:hypothetical protein
MTCRFNGACYGVICVSPRICRKAESELTDEDRAAIEEVLADERGSDEADK